MIKLKKKEKAWLANQPPIPEDFTSDYCTFCADRWFGVDLRPACRKHDWFYSRGRSGEASTRHDRLMGDRVFRFDTYHLLRRKFSTFYSVYFSYKRYWFVRMMAGPAFQGKVGDTG